MGPVTATKIALRESYASATYPLCALSNEPALRSDRRRCLSEAAS
jgi:hypothetical protein